MIFFTIESPMPLPPWAELPLEELGIGRPSTYSPTITTIIARRYITEENKNLYVTEIGSVVNSIMKAPGSVLPGFWDLSVLLPEYISDTRITAE